MSLDFEWFIPRQTHYADSAGSRQLRIFPTSSSRARMRIQKLRVCIKELDIPQNRVYLIFEELFPTHWAWNGKTFG